MVIGIDIKKGAVIVTINILNMKSRTEMKCLRYNISTSGCMNKLLNNTIRGNFFNVPHYFKNQTFL